MCQYNKYKTRLVITQPSKIKLNLIGKNIHIYPRTPANDWQDVITVRIHIFIHVSEVWFF